MIFVLKSFQNVSSLIKCFLQNNVIVSNWLIHLVFTHLQETLVNRLLKFTQSLICMYVFRYVEYVMMIPECIIHIHFHYNII